MKSLLNKLLPAFICLTFLVSACKRVPLDSIQDTSIDKVSVLCEEQVLKYEYPGLAVVIYKEGRPILKRGFGYADLDQKRTIDPHGSLFRIGSISKTITGTVLCKMADRADIDLDKPIGHYLSDIPEDKRSLTLRQLAGHTAGIRHYHGLEFMSNVSYTDVFEPLKVFIQDTLLFEPGTKYSYTTYGWTLISAVMARVSGRPFLDLVKEEVLSPLALDMLKPDIKDSISYNRVSFYMKYDEKMIPTPSIDQSNKWAGGGYIATPDELARLGQAISKPGLLSKSALALCTATQFLPDGSSLNYGIGYASGIDEKGRYWYGHSGGSVGGTSMMLIYPQQELVVVTLVNQSGANMDKLAWKIADLLL